MTAVTVYSKPACVQCTATKRWLDKRNIEYTEVDVTQDTDALEFIKGLGYLAAPVVYVSMEDGDTYWSEFNPGNLTLYLGGK